MRAFLLTCCFVPILTFLAMIGHGIFAGGFADIQLAADVVFGCGPVFLASFAGLVIHTTLYDY